MKINEGSSSLHPYQDFAPTLVANQESLKADSISVDYLKQGGF